MNVIEIRKLTKSGEHHGTHGRYHRDSASYGVFLDGQQVASLQNEGAGDYMAAASWTMNYTDERGNLICPARWSDNTLAKMKEQVPRMLAMAGLIDLPGVQVDEKTAQRVSSGNVARLADDVRNLLRK